LRSDGKFEAQINFGHLGWDNVKECNTIEEAREYIKKRREYLIKEIKTEKLQRVVVEE